MRVSRTIIKCGSTPTKIEISKDEIQSLIIRQLRKLKAIPEAVKDSEIHIKFDISTFGHMEHNDFETELEGAEITINSKQKDEVVNVKEEIEFKD